MRSNANAHIEAVKKKKKVPANHSAYTEVLCLLLREPLLKKGPSDGGRPLCHCVTSPRTAGSHSQTLSLKLSVLFCSVLLQGFFILGEPYMRKNQLKKSLERGMGKAFLQKGFPHN